MRITLKGELILKHIVIAPGMLSAWTEKVDMAMFKAT